MLTGKCTAQNDKEGLSERTFFAFFDFILEIELVGHRNPKNKNERGWGAGLSAKDLKTLWGAVKLWGILKTYLKPSRLSYL